MESKGSNDDDNATISDVSVEVNPSNSSPTPDSQSNNDPSDNDSTEALAKALSSMLTSLIKDFDSKAHDTLTSQDLLSSSIDRLTRAELDQLLEDAPLPFIMQHAAKFSNVRKRVFSLNLLLKSIQRRIDNIDRMLSMGLQHGWAYEFMFFRQLMKGKVLALRRVSCSLNELETLPSDLFIYNPVVMHYTLNRIRKR
ncbi:Snapin/Pallidin/Snn1 - like 1 [Theobroma cacao]|nr:Snapin/Pallidin/Snn1 - like 1 [Theobroma cacao]